MNQQKQSNSFGDKFLNYVNSLCIGVPSEISSLPRKSSYSSEKSRNSTSKPKRMTFLLDRTLLKLSRKNLVVQQFAGQQAFISQIQDHIVSRVLGLSIAILSGDFSQKVYKKITFALRMPKDTQNNSISIQQILASSNLPKTRKGGPVNVMIFNQKVNSFKLIQQTLTTYYREVKKFVFVIEAEVEAIQYHKLFVTYRDYFIFQVEKIMVINKCIANIIYVSDCGQFLKIDNNALACFFSEEVGSKDPIVSKQDFSNLTLRLLNAGMHVETTCVVGQLISTFLPNHYDQQFVIRMKKKSSKSQAIIDEFLSELTKSYKEQMFKVPQFHQNTPEFKLEEESLQNMERELQNSLKSQSNNINNGVNVSFGVMIKKHNVIN